MGQVSREILMMFCFIIAGAFWITNNPLWIRLPIFAELVILGNLFLILNNKSLLNDLS